MKSGLPVLDQKKNYFKLRIPPRTPDTPSYPRYPLVPQIPTRTPDTPSYHGYPLVPQIPLLTYQYPLIRTRTVIPITLVPSELSSYPRTLVPQTSYPSPSYHEHHTRHPRTTNIIPVTLVPRTSMYPFAPIVPHIQPFVPRIQPFVPHIQPFVPHIQPYTVVDSIDYTHILARYDHPRMPLPPLLARYDNIPWLFSSVEMPTFIPIMCAWFAEGSVNVSAISGFCVCLNSKG